MKSEDVDWKLYHLIPEGERVSVAQLAVQSGFTEDVIRSSLARLECSFLISVQNDTAALCSIEDFIMGSQLQEDDLFTIENGIIKVK